MDIKLLEDFVCLARLENFTAASLERNITQSALSRRIKALEAWLGAKLINRDSKNFNLTLEGRVFISEAEVILRRLYNAREAVSTMHRKQEVEIAVAAQNSIAQTLFLEWAKRLETRFENIYIRLLSEKLADCVELFSQGKADYLFCYAHEALSLPLDEKKFSGTTIGREYLVPVSIPDQNGKPRFTLPGSATQPLPYVAYAHDSLFGKALDQLIRNYSHTCFLQRRFENVYSHTLKSMAKEGLGLAWLPESAILSDLEKGGLCRAGDRHWDIGFDVRLFYRHTASSATELSIQEISLQMAADHS
ncbi:MAG: LysR family transcriptional regulator [Thiolinea sp.]